MIVAFALLIEAAAMPAIKIVPGTGNELIAEVAPFEERLLSEVHDAAANAMTAACKGRPIGWGSVRFSGQVSPGASKPTMVVGYRQTFRCLDLDPAHYPHAPANWKASVADEDTAVRVFRTYFDARDAGALERAFAMLEPSSQGDRAQWRSSQQLAQTLLAGKGTRSVTGLRWFLDPPEAPFPGIFARVTFEGRFPGAAVYCGSMVLYRAGPDSYLLGGVRESILPLRDNPTAERAAEFRNRFCG